MKHLLTAKDLYGFVEGTEEAPADDAAADVKSAFTKNCSKAFSTIVLAVGDNVLYLITECADAKSAWDKLQAHFEQNTLASKLFFFKKAILSKCHERRYTYRTSP